MIAKIGYKRTVTLVCLTGLLCVLAGTSYFLFRPQTVSAQADLQATKSELETKKTEVEKMQNDFALFQQEKDFYGDLMRMGFFGAQDRVIAREKFNVMQKLSKIISAQYEIKPAIILKDQSPPESEYVLMESPIEISLNALDDLDIYRFIYYLNYAFPGHITIDSLNIQREKKVDLEALKQIGTGNPVSLVSARMNLSWRTMAKKDSISQKDLESETPAGGEQ